MADYSIDTTIYGGSTISSAVDADVTSTLTGLDDMKLALSGGTTTTLAGENTVHTDSAVTLAPVTTSSTVSSDASVTTTSTLDVKPVAVDACVRLELGLLPPTTVCTPYEQTWGWSVLGLELFSLTVRGSTTTHVRPERPAPVVVDL